MDIIVKKFKISNTLSFYGAMHHKLRSCKIKIELEKMGFASRIFFSIFSDFHLMLADHPKFLTFKFFNFLKTNTKTVFMGASNI